MVGVDDSGVPWMRSPIRLDGADREVGEAPAQGEHSTQLLAEIGYSDAEIEQLLRTGIIRQAQ